MMTTTTKIECTKNAKEERNEVREREREREREGERAQEINITL